MGAIVAAISKRNDDVVPLVIMMLEALIHRGNSSHEVITPSGAVSAESLDELNKASSVASSVSAGRNVSEIRRGYDSLMLRNDNVAVFEGQVFPHYPTHPFSHTVVGQTCLPNETAENLLRNLDGHYAFAVVASKQMLVGRDQLGVMPLYCGESEELCAVASERKALWKIGLTNVQSFPPGCLGTASKAGFAFKLVSTIRQPPMRKMKMNKAARRLQKLLHESTEERVMDVEKVGVAFSGGLDSSVIAHLAQTCGVQVDLISVGLEGQSELGHAEEAAKALGLPIAVQTFKIADVERALSRVLWLIEEPDVMKIGVAIPLFWTAQVASKRGHNVLLAGQGADELLGGYSRYLEVYAKHGAANVAKSLYNDTVMSYETNFQRDEPVSTFHNIDLRLPFVDANLIRFALSLPVNLKVESENDSLRKRVLRRVAKNLGVPSCIADKPKKAIQFATGVDKALRNLAKSKDSTPQKYLEEVFRTSFPPA